LRAGQYSAAERFFRELLAIQADAGAWFCLGAAQHSLGKLHDAARSFRNSIDLADAIDARCALAAVLSSLGQQAEAEAELRQAIDIHPDHPQALSNLAIAVEQRGDHAEALALYDRTLAADPAYEAARLNRGALRLALGDAEAALADFEPLASIAGANNRTQALLALHRDAEALVSAEAVLRRDPSNARARRDRALALASTGQLDAVIPEVDALTTYVARALERQWNCDWRDRDRLVETLRTEQRFSDPGFLLRSLALPLNPGDTRRLADTIASAIRARIAGMTLAGPVKPSGSRIRVGFLSPEYRAHTGGFVLRRLFSDRDRSRFEYFAYALNPDDGSAIRKELQSSSDQFLDVSSWSALDIARRMREDGLDIVLDRTGYFEGMKPEVLALKPAPVLASFMGTPCTLGEGLVDYRISDAWTTPPGSEVDWPEKLVIVPTPYPVFDSDLIAREPGSRGEYGIPENAVVLCHFDQPHKTDPEVFRIWMRLLDALPQAVLCLLEPGRLAVANLQREAAARGVDRKRLIFVPQTAYESHLKAIQLADLFLDGLIYSSRSMAFNALNAGVPVLAHAGHTMVSRLSSGFLHALGMDELIATSPQDYEKKALELVTRPEALQRVRTKLAEKRVGSPVFDTVARVRAVERAFVAMVERHRAGLPPDTLIVE
jgi:protein O-GlcNAc transferase